MAMSMVTLGGTRIRNLRMNRSLWNAAGLGRRMVGTLDGWDTRNTFDGAHSYTHLLCNFHTSPAFLLLYVSASEVDVYTLEHFTAHIGAIPSI